MEHVFCSLWIFVLEFDKVPVTKIMFVWNVFFSIWNTYIHSIKEFQVDNNVKIKIHIDHRDYPYGKPLFLMERFFVPYGKKLELFHKEYKFFP